MKNKNIIITGASQGLGYDLAKNFAKNGAKLFLIARSEKNLKIIKNNCNHRNRHKIFSYDLNNISNIKHVVNEANIFFKNKIDAVVHVAGGGLGLKNILINNSDLLKVINLNILSSIEFNRLILPIMNKKKKGNIVHIGSIASSEAGGSLSYNLSKSILHAYVRTVGNEFAKKNIIITGVALGGFMSKNNAMHRLKINNPKAYKKFINTRLPRKIIGKTSEIIPLVEFLCSKNAGMMCGCVVPADAGEGKSYNIY
jgi:short-subunit dehydrogenase